MPPPAAQPLPHAIVKVRLLPEPAGQAAADRGRAWVAVRAMPPGLQPTFLGTLWYFHAGEATARAPVLQLLPAHAEAGAPMRYLNLFFDPVTGGSALLNPAAGWRRIDFMFNLPPESGPVRLRAVVPDPGSASGAPARIESGTLQKVLGAWQSTDRPDQANPFRSAEAPPLRVGFVGGAPKSGTTWMQLLLNQHDDIAASGEGEWLRAVRMRPWRSSIRWFPPEVSQDGLDDFSNFAVLMRCFNMRREHTGAPVVVDKSPGNAQVYRRLLAFVPGARLIHCLRHPLDVLISRLHHEATILQKTGSPALNMDAHIDAIRSAGQLLAEPGPLRFDAGLWSLAHRVLDEYAEMQREALVTMRDRPGKLLITRYEDMLADGEASAARAFAHLGVTTSAEHLAACVRNTTFTNLRDSRQGRSHHFYRSGTANQFAAVLETADQRRAIDYLRGRLPEFDQLGYAEVSPEHLHA